MDNRRVCLTALAALGLIAGRASAADLGPVEAGLAERMNEAARNLQPGGERLAATRALDASRRLARVLKSPAGCPAAGSREPLAAVNAARHAVQVGRPGTAGAILAEAAGRLRPRQPMPPCVVTASAVGKPVVDARGERVGRLVALSRQGGAATLETGGAINWFGFLDFGARRVSVPADRLVEGRRTVVFISDNGPRPLGTGD